MRFEVKQTSMNRTAQVKAAARFVQSRGCRMFEGPIGHERWQVEMPDGDYAGFPTIAALMGFLPNLYRFPVRERANMEVSA